MCLAGHRAVFDTADDGTDPSRAEIKETGAKTTFKLLFTSFKSRNRVWEDHPRSRNRDCLGNHAKTTRGRAVSTRMARSLAGRPLELENPSPAEPGP